MDKRKVRREEREVSKEMSDWFIFLSQFLSTLQQKFEWGVKGFKTTDMLQLNYSRSEQLNRHSQDMGAGQPQSCHYNFSWVSLFILPICSFCLPCAKQGLSPPPIKEGNANKAYAQGQLIVASYITTGSMAHVFP